MQHEATRRWVEWEADDGIMLLDDASVELIEEPSSPDDALDDAKTRVWIRPYAARPWARPRHLAHGPAGGRAPASSLPRPRGRYSIS